MTSNRAFMTYPLLAGIGSCARGVLADGGLDFSRRSRPAGEDAPRRGETRRASGPYGVGSSSRCSRSTACSGTWIGSPRW